MRTKKFWQVECSFNRNYFEENERKGKTSNLMKMFKSIEGKNLWKRKSSFRFYKSFCSKWKDLEKNAPFDKFIDKSLVFSQKLRKRFLVVSKFSEMDFKRKGFCKIVFTRMKRSLRHKVWKAFVFVFRFSFHWMKNQVEKDGSGKDLDSRYVRLDLDCRNIGLDLDCRNIGLVFLFKNWGKG